VIDTIKGVKPGQLCKKTDESVWRLIGIWDAPTIELENLETGERKVVLVGSRVAGEFIMLVPLKGTPGTS